MPWWDERADEIAAEYPEVKHDKQHIDILCARFVLQRCLPVKLKAPPLNAKDGAVAIEELQLVYESLTLKRPGGGQGA